MALADLFREGAPPEEQAVARPRSAAASGWKLPVMWAALGAAAAVLVMAALPAGTAGGSGSVRGDALASSLNGSAGTAAGKGVLPVSSSREWLAVEDQGISFDSPDNPLRQMRVQTVERHRWIDPRDGAEYTVEVPQVESVALPVKFQ